MIKRKLYLYTVLLFTIISGTISLLLFVIEATNQIEYNSKGILVNGTVNEITEIDEGDGGISYRIDVQFNYNGTDYVTSNRFRLGKSKYNVGDSVKIKILPTSPEKARIQSTIEVFWPPVILLAVTVGMYALGILVWRNKNWVLNHLE